MTDAILDTLGLSQELLAKAQPLGHLGIQERAWPRDAAADVVRHLSDRPIAVLGGDVIRQTPAGLRHDYSNWHSDPLPGEPFHAFALRSQSETLAYLERFPRASPDPYFVLVLATGLPKPPPGC